MDDSKYKYPQKLDYRDLSDADFIRNLDVLAGNYYSDYIQGRAQFTGNIDSFMSSTSTKGCKAMPYPLLPPRQVTFTGFYFKRVFPVIVAFLCVLIQIAYFALTFVGDGFWAETLPFFEGGMLLSAPLLAMFGQSSAYAVESVSALWMTGVGILLFGLGALISFLTLLCTLFSKRKKDGTFRRVNSTVPMAFSLVGAVVSVIGILLSGKTPGMGFVALVGAAIVAFVCSFCFYKKGTASIPEIYFDVNGKLKKEVNVLDFVTTK